MKPAGRAIAAACAGLALALSSAMGGARADTAPVNTTLPTISGTARDGQALSASPGTWSGSGPISYAYQWRRCDSEGAGCAEVAGATGKIYMLSGSDIGWRMQVAVTASDTSGSTTATSAPTAAVVAAKPVNTSRPSVSGTTRQGETLLGDAGTWTGTTPISLAYVWKRCDSAGSNCVAITGADEPTYTLAAADVGHTLRLRVYATNIAGTGSSYSAATTIIVEPGR